MEEERNVDATYLYISLVVGLAVSLLFSEYLGINPGGMIVPGYLALICDDLSQMLIVFGICMLVYLIVEYVLPRFMILFGRRRFVATLIVSVVIKLALELVYPALPFGALEFRGMGVITPGLIANSSSKQGFRYTVPSVLAATYLTFGITTLLFWLM